MLGQAFISSEREKPGRKWRDQFVSREWQCLIINKEQNPITGTERPVFFVGMERRHVNQIAVRRVPDGVMHGDEIGGTWNVGNAPGQEHPARLAPPAIQTDFPTDILKTTRMQAPELGTVLRESQWLVADSSREGRNLITQVCVGRTHGSPHRLKHFGQARVVNAAALMDRDAFKPRTALRKFFLQVRQAHAGAIFGDETLKALAAAAVALGTGNVQHRGFRSHLG